MSDREIPRISWSEINIYNRCKRQWKLSYFDGYRKREEIPVESRHIGKTFHDFLDWYHFDNKERSPVEIYNEQIAEFADKDPDSLPVLQKSYKLLKKMSEMYMREDSRTDIVMNPSERDVHIETPVRGDDEHPYILHGYIDMIGVNGIYFPPYIIESKTTKSVQAKWISSDLPIALPQVKFYCLISGLRQVIFNVARRNLGTAKAQRPLLWRTVVNFSDAEIDLFHRQISPTINEIVKTYETYDKYDLPFDTSTTFPSRGFHCSFLCRYNEICADFDDPFTDADAILNTDFISRKERELEEQST